MADASRVQGFEFTNRSGVGDAKESLWDMIVTIDPLETFVSSNAPTVKVGDIQHQWVQKNPRSVASRSAVEGKDPTFDNTSTSRDSNWTQIIQIGYELTGSRVAANTIGGDLMSRERNEAMRSLKNSLEFDLIRGTLVTGNASTARRMKGMTSFASTLATSQSGVSLSEKILNDYLGNAWDQGTEIDTLLVGKVLKARISGFTSGNTKNVEASEATLYGRVDVLDTDYGRVRVLKHRYVTQSGDTNYDLLGYDSGYVHVGVFRSPKVEALAKTGDSEREQVIGEFTLQVDNEKGIVYGQKHL